MMNANILHHSNSCGYGMLNRIGNGSFGTVYECVKLSTCETVAVKMLKRNMTAFFEREVNIHEALRALDADKNNIVKFMESFEYNDYFCLVFEKLDISLSNLIMIQRKPFDLNEIRPVAHQLVVALDALYGLGIVHADLKPDNIMLVDHINKPLKIKVIDFGLAHRESELDQDLVLQPLAYRAPEVILGLPFSADIDMWSVGCILAFMYFGQRIFPPRGEYHVMTVMLQLLGQPPKLMLDLGQSTEIYFKRHREGWKLKTPVEYQKTTGMQPEISDHFIRLNTDLRTAVHKYKTKRDRMEMRDKEAFLKLLQSCLKVDYEVRVTPRKAKSFCFLTMAHLRDDFEICKYTIAASQLMIVTTLSHSHTCNISVCAEGIIQEPKSAHSPNIELLLASGNSSAAVTNRDTDVSTRAKASGTASIKDSPSSNYESGVDKRDTNTNTPGIFKFRSTRPQPTRSHTECFPTTSNMSAHVISRDTDVSRTGLSLGAMSIIPRSSSNVGDIVPKSTRSDNECFSATRSILVTEPTTGDATAISKCGVAHVPGPSDVDGVRSRDRTMTFFSRLRRFYSGAKDTVVRIKQRVRVGYRRRRFMDYSFIPLLG